MKYSLDLNYLMDGACCSYENGAYDDMYFDTEKEAEKYAKKNKYRLSSNEILLIVEEGE